MAKKLAIVGIFYDGYYDIWEDFLELFEKNWPDCPYPLYIVDQVKQLEYEKAYKAIVINAGADAEYSRKVQKAVSDIDADYLLLLLEDFFISKPVDTVKIQEVFDVVVNRNISYCAIPAKEFTGGASFQRESEEGYDFIKKINDKDEYTVSCQAAIWDKDFLRECIGTENYNAWIFEGIYIYSKHAHSPEFLSKLRVDYRNILNIRHGAVQGKLLPTVYSDIVATGYSFKTKREVLNKESYDKHLRKQKLKKALPIGIQRVVKKVFSVNSVSEKYKDEIFETMKKMNIS